MKQTMSSFRRLVLTIKFYLQRASTYFVFVNSVMLLFILFSRLGLQLSLSKTEYIFIGIGWLLLMIVVGWMDQVFGLYSTEMKLQEKRNPITSQHIQESSNILKEIRSLKKQVNKLKRDKNA